MHYPWWFVPFLTAPMLIAVISVLHVIVSHYAVGGGIFLAVETRFAYRTHSRNYLAYLKDHAWFFILITVVYGAITGVGIWWTIGLASPLATETLIHAFVFGWGMEYVFFLLEIVSAFIFYYFWGRLEARTHQVIGWIYAVSAWISLVLITGITGFMLNTGSWPRSHGFWAGFFNPQFLPQVLVRTGGAILLTALFVYLHSSFRAKDTDLRKIIVRRSTRPVFLGVVLLVLGSLSWFLALPESAQANLAGASVLNVLLALGLGVLALILGTFYLGPYRNPGWLSPGFAILFLALGIAAVATGEFIREAVRKPYIVYNVVLSNQILPEEISKLRNEGYLEGGTWTKAFVARDYPQVLSNGKVDQAKLSALPEADQVKVGEVLFMHHCNDCHSGRRGYSAVGALTQGWTPEMIKDLAREPEKVRFAMPPWCGTEEEAELLSKFIRSITPPHPAGMYYGNGR